jgi:N-acetylneuraminate lyase
MRPLNGVIPALMTPFADDGSVDLESLAALVRFLLSCGVDGFYVAGTSGEWFRLSREERRRIAELVVAETAGRVPVAVHVGHFSTAAAVELADHAARIGADAVSSVLPGQFGGQPLAIAEIAGYYRAIAAAGLPVIAYFLEGASSPLQPRAFVESIASIDGVIGLKYTASDLFPAQAVVDLSGGRLRFWGGHDQMAVAALAMGAAGVIGTSHNYMPERFVGLYRAFRSGDLAQAARAQAEANRVSWAVKRFGQIAAYKAVLELRGVAKMGLRAPAQPLDADQRRALAAAAASFFP